MSLSDHARRGMKDVLAKEIGHGSALEKMIDHRSA